MKFISVILTVAVMLFAGACAPFAVATQPAPNPGPIEITANAVTVIPAMETATKEVVLPTVIGLPEVRPTAQPVGTASPSGGIPENGITLQDNGRTFYMHVGESFLLNLGMDIYDWSVEVDNQSVLSREMNIMVIRGAQGIYLAHAPGQAVLTATGNPPCAQSNPPCMMPSLLFTVTVIVQ